MFIVTGTLGNLPSPPPAPRFAVYCRFAGQERLIRQGFPTYDAAALWGRLHPPAQGTAVVRDL